MIAIGLFTIAFGIQSCEDDPQILGRDLLPEDDDFIVRSDTHFIIETYTELPPPIISGNKFIGILGSYQDDQFGRSRAEFLTQVGLQENKDYDLGENPAVDSLIVYLRYDLVFGDTMSVQTVRVFELTEDLLDTSYYSDLDPTGMFDPVELGSSTISARDTIARIKITRPDFLERFISGEDSIYKDPFDFKDFFKGIYVTTDTVDTGGAFYYVKFGSPGVSSFLQLFFRNDSTDSLDHVFTTTTTEINVNPFRHSYAGSAVGNFFSDEPTTDSVLFVQAMGGARIRFQFPELKNWHDSMPVAINSAQMVLYPEDTLLTGLSADQYPVKLFLRFVEESGNETRLLDYVIEKEGSELVDGNFDEENNRYLFNIGYHLQNYLNGLVPFPDLIIVPANANLSANRVILKSPFHNSPQRMQLKIVYTKL